MAHLFGKSDNYLEVRWRCQRLPSGFVWNKDWCLWSVAMDWACHNREIPHLSSTLYDTCTGIIFLFIFFILSIPFLASSWSRFFLVVPPWLKAESLKFLPICFLPKWDGISKSTTSSHWLIQYNILWYRFALLAAVYPTMFVELNNLVTKWIRCRSWYVQATYNSKGKIN